MINTAKLDKELKDAGIKTSGCNSNGIVWAEDGTTEIQNRKDVKAIIAAHDPTPEPEPPSLEDRMKALETKLAKVETDISALKK